MQRKMKKIVSYLLSFVMVFSMMPSIAFAAETGAAKDWTQATQLEADKNYVMVASNDSGNEGDEEGFFDIGFRNPFIKSTYVAFTSDIHNDSVKNDNISAKRLETWIDNAAMKNRTIFDNMGLCGDIGSARQEGDIFWSCVQVVMDTVKNSSMVKGDGFFIAGNHEYDNGSFSTTTNATAKNIQKVGSKAETSEYIFYNFGATSTSSRKAGFLTEDINALKAYLASAPTNKPIFVLSHFPIHSYGSRFTKNAAKLTSVLNKAGMTHKIIFLWGHNHTLSDPNYDQIITDKIGDTPINFTYAAAGCMSDSEYSGSATKGSASVKGKGLVAKIKGMDVTLTYYAEDGTVVATGTTPDPDPTFVVEKAANVITASNVTAYYNTKARKITIEASAEDNAKLTYKTDSTKLTINKSTGTVSIPKKYMGQVTITITSAETEYYLKTKKKITFKVAPTKTALSIAKNIKGKKITLKWKKVSVATGYQIQYSRSSKFASGNKFVNVTKKGIISRTLKNLKKGKKYYVRIRTYKTIGKTQIYSGWSKSKKVKVTK